MKTVRVKDPRFWTSLVSKLLENYKVGTKLEVPRDGQWHWHVGKHLDDGSRKNQYVIIYFRNMGKAKSITVDEDLRRAIKKFAGLQWTGMDRDDWGQLEVSIMNCRFVYLRLEKGEEGFLPRSTTNYDPGCNEYKNEYIQDHEEGKV
jgi:hypothetical protein